jgi:hypothetical protein
MTSVEIKSVLLIRKEIDMCDRVCTTHNTEDTGAIRSLGATYKSAWCYRPEDKNIQCLKHVTPQVSRVLTVSTDSLVIVLLSLVR